MALEQAIDEERLIGLWIEEDPHKRPVADARLKEYGIPVWALIMHLQAVDGDLDQVARDYEVPHEAARAAVAFYHRHKAAIDYRVTMNAA
jgi:uncharacterized protein (DUF433 family)